MKKYFGTGIKSGFTLIELLVVIAIIAILAAVVMAALGSGRDKATDAAIKQAMSSARGQAELYYATQGQTFTGVCGAAPGIGATLLNAAQRTGATVGPLNFAWGLSGGAGAAVCHESANSWAAITSLRSPLTFHAGWCVDSSGASREATTLTSTTCP